MHTSRNIRNAGTISIYLLFCNPVKIYEVWSMKYEVTNRERSLPGLTPHSHLAGFLYRYSFVLKKDWTWSHEWKWFDRIQISKSKVFFEVHGQKKTPYKNEKRKHANKFRRPSHGARQKNSELSETKFQKKKSFKKISKTDNEVLFPARESMKRPLTPFFPLPWRPSLRNCRLSESRASINIKIVALDQRNDFNVYRSSTVFGIFWHVFFFRFCTVFFLAVYFEKNFALRYLDSVKPFSFVWPSPIFL